MGIWWRQHAAAVRGLVLCTVLYTALAVAFTYPLAMHLESGILQGQDTEDALQQTWVLNWVQHVLLTHQQGLFDAPIFWPTRGALAYHDNMAPVAVLLLPVRLLTSNPLVIYNIAVLASFPLCALAMYALAYHLAHDRRAASLAGIVFAFCPYRERHIEHLNLLSAEGIPLAILAFELSRERGGAWRWLGLGLAVALCAALSIYYLAFTVLGLGVYLGYLLFRHRQVIAAGALRGCWAAGPGLVLAGAALLPYARAQRSVGSERHLDSLVYFSADVRDFLHAASRNLLYGWSDRLWRINPLDVRQYLFPGWTVLALGLFSAWLGARIVRRGGTRRAGDTIAVDYMLVAALLGVLALGPYLRLFGSFTRFPLPYLFVYYVVPGFSGFRDVARIDQVLMAFLGGAAAIGAARVFAIAGARRATRVFVALTALIVVEYWTVQRPLLAVPSGARIPAVYSWIAHQPRGVVAELPMCGLQGAPCREESWYMYYSTYHWHPLVNGGGGYFPPDWNQRTAALATFPAPEAIAMLRRLDVRYVIVHPDFPGIARVRHVLDGNGTAPAKGFLARKDLNGDLLFVLPATSVRGVKAE